MYVFVLSDVSIKSSYYRHNVASYLYLQSYESFAKSNYITQYFSSKCSTPSQLLLCSSSSMENGHLEKLIQSRSTPLKYMFITILQKSSYLPTQAKHYYKGIPSILANLGFVWSTKIGNLMTIWSMNHEYIRRPHQLPSSTCLEPGCFLALSDKSFRTSNRCLAQIHKASFTNSFRYQ